MMKKRSMSLMAAFLLATFAVAAVPARAAESPLQVAADPAFGETLAEIAPLFTESTGCEVDLSYGNSDYLSGELLSRDPPADVCLPADTDTIDHLREKGAIDVALARNVVVLDRPGEDPVYLRAVVFSGARNRIQALAFLDFLVSESARGIFADHGFSLP